MKANNIKSIDVLTKCWFDKVNGNTYFAQKITINRGKKSEETIFNPFQYGYSSYNHFALQFVRDHYNLKTDITKYEFYSNISFNNEVIRGCKKRDLTHISEY